MAVAYFKVHFPQSPFPTVKQRDGADSVLLPVFVSDVRGAGVWSLDALLVRHKPRPPMAWRVVREPEPWARLHPS
jgi:hypothetical protein